jgi:hypothetical protein
MKTSLTKTEKIQVLKGFTKEAVCIIAVVAASTYLLIASTFPTLLF